MSSKNSLFFGKKADKPDAKPENKAPTLGFFFKQLWRNFNKLLTLNLVMLVQALPVLAIIFIYIYTARVPFAESPLYAPLLGAYTADGSPLSALLLGVFGQQTGLPVLTTGRTVAIIILASVLSLTWGWQNVGAAYNLRSLVRGDSFFLLSDYFYAIRRNLKQGFFFGLLDLAIMGVLGFDLFYFSAYPGNAFSGVMYVIILALFVLYIVMRFYLYLMMITFDLSVKKLLKNAMIFSVLGIKRNLMALLGIAVVVGVNFAVIMLCLSVGFSATLVIPLFYIFALLGFITTYAAYPIIQRYMIDPYEPKQEASTQKTQPNNS